MSADWEIFSRECKKTVKYLLRKHPVDRADLGEIFHFPWVKKFQDIGQEKIMKLDESTSTIENSKTLNLMKGFCQKSKSVISNPFSEQTTKKEIVKKKRVTENLIEIKLQTEENKKSNQESSTMLSKIPTFFENHQV